MLVGGSQSKMISCFCLAQVVLGHPVEKKTRSAIMVS